MLENFGNIAVRVSRILQYIKDWSSHLHTWWLTCGKQLWEKSVVTVARGIQMYSIC